MCIANAQLHGFICTWTHNLMELLPYRQHLSILLHVHACLILGSPESLVTYCYWSVYIVVRRPFVNTFFLKTSGPILTKFGM